MAYFECLAARTLGDQFVSLIASLSKLRLMIVWVQRDSKNLLIVFYETGNASNASSICMW